MKTGIILGLIFMMFLIYKVIKRQKKIKAEKEQFGDTIENIVEESLSQIKKRKEEPFKISKEEVLKKISEMFPKADLVCLSYMGSGDDFEEFGYLTTEIELAKPIEHEGWIQKYETDEDFSDYEEIEKFVNLEVSDGNTIVDYIWEVFEKANNSPNFNNAGSYGGVTFDIKNNTVSLANTYKEYSYDDDGNIDDYEDDIENECEKEEF